MANLGKVDSETFYRELVYELRHSEHEHNQYKLERRNNIISVYGRIFFEFYMETEVADENQMRDIYDRLSVEFDGNFKDFVRFADPYGELHAFLNGHFLEFDSDAKADHWIFEKVYGVPIKENKTPTV